MKDYKQKLIEWNATEKYRKELDFLYMLINPQLGEFILDYGCGIMTALKIFNSREPGVFFGYDVVEYSDQIHSYDMDLKRKYNTIYLNHSLAHIENAKDALIKLRENLKEGGKIVIVTPNYEWLDTGYIGDPTVICHYNLETLSKLVESAGYKIDQIGEFGTIKKNIHQHNRLNCERLFIVAK